MAPANKTAAHHAVHLRSRTAFAASLSIPVSMCDRVPVAIQSVSFSQSQPNFRFIWDWNRNYAVSIEINRPVDRRYHIAMVGLPNNPNDQS
jgi:hypothetical protein